MGRVRNETHKRLEIALAESSAAAILLAQAGWSWANENNATLANVLEYLKRAESKLGNSRNDVQFAIKRIEREQQRRTKVRSAPPPTTPIVGGEGVSTEPAT